MFSFVLCSTLLTLESFLKNSSFSEKIMVMKTSHKLLCNMILEKKLCDKDIELRMKFSIPSLSRSHKRSFQSFS